MNDKHFHLRMHCSYEGSKNKITDLKIEVYEDKQWKNFELSTRSPGFFLFINGLFSCQHLYMRANCAERGLILESSAGELKIIAGEFWNIKDASINFKVKLKSGSPTANHIHYITERMKHCPVSSNLADSILIKNSLIFE